MSNAATIALLGQPNSGKSTLFNALTGLRQHVGNWPGKTVEKLEGSFSYNGKDYKVTDLPGSYSLSANSDEEVITRDYIASGEADVVCILADSSQLERSLYMVADYAGINVPCFLLLNLADVAEDQGKKIDTEAIEKKLGIPVLLFSATDKENYGKFYETLNRAIEEKTTIKIDRLESYYEKIEGYEKIKSLMANKAGENGGGDSADAYSPMWLAVKELESDKNEGYRNAIATGESKFAWIDYLLDGAVNKVNSQVVLSKLDRIYTSKRWGKPAVVITAIIGLLASFIPALPLMGLGMLIPYLKIPVSSLLTSVGCPVMLEAFINDVVIQSLAYIVQMLGFVFGVSLVFGFLEEVGIMARMSYVFDNTMAKLGLQGKSIMPFLVSFGCTMGGAAGSRVIDNWGQKVLTIALAWAVPCGAAWSIVPMLSTVFFGWRALFVIIALLLTMVLHMWITAKIFGRGLVKQEDRYGIIMELPPYHKPKWGVLFRYVLGRTKDTFFRVLKVVLLVCAVFWILSYSTTSAEGTILYKIGIAIEPVTKVFGLKWQLFMAFVASSVGKEGAVGVISALFTGTGSIYGAVQGAAVAANINEILLNNVTRPEALAFIFAITFNLPCVVALAATYQEIHSAKWTAIIAVYYTLGALVLAGIAYRIGLLIW